MTIDVAMIHNARQACREYEDLLREASTIDGAGAARLVRRLTKVVDEMRGELEQFDAKLPHYNEALSALAAAESALRAARASRSAGSLNPDDAVRLLLEEEITSQAERIRRRNVEAARATAQGHLHRVMKLARQPGRESAEQYVLSVAVGYAKRFTLDERAHLEDLDLALWEPLYVARVTSRKGFAELVEDQGLGRRRREAGSLDVRANDLPDVEGLREFFAERVAMREALARARLEEAEKHAAALAAED